MIYVKGKELTRENDEVVIGVSEEEFSKSLIYYAVSTMQSGDLEGLLKGLLNGNNVNLSVSLGNSCGSGHCGCSEKKTKFLEEDDSRELKENIEILEVNDEEVIQLADLDVEMMRESLIEKGEIRIDATSMADKCPVVWSIITGSKNQFNKNIMLGCDIRLQLNINNVTYSILKNKNEDISPANNVVFYWDKADIIAIEEMFNLI